MVKIKLQRHPKIVEIEDSMGQLPRRTIGMKTACPMKECPSKTESYQSAHLISQLHVWHLELTVESSGLQRAWVFQLSSASLLTSSQIVSFMGGSISKLSLPWQMSHGPGNSNILESPVKLKLHPYNFTQCLSSTPCRNSGPSLPYRYRISLKPWGMISQVLQSSEFC